MIQGKVVQQYKEKKYFTHETEMLEQEARLASTFMEKWGVVACVQDGEDSVGRVKFRPLTPAELVERASESAKLFFDHVRSNSLVHKAPEIDAFDESA